MPVYKEKNGTYTARFYIPTFEGNKKQHNKRGFKTKKEAKNYEIEFLAQKKYSVTMTFRKLYELYIDDMSSRLKENTIITKKFIIENKILPYFEKRKVEDITPVLIRTWQAKMLRMKKEDGKPYSKTYMRTLNNQISAMFNYAVKFHGLSYNPVRRAGTIGMKNANEMNIWKIEEFNLFIKELKHKPMQEMGFKILFWTGMRIGELLALTISDINLSKNKIRINKSYQRIKRKDVITEPKTLRSIRTIEIDENLKNDIKKYISKIYNPTKNTRLFHCSKTIFNKDMKKYSEIAKVKPIRVHDLRHSHASLLLHAGMDIATISRRLGHENIETTLKTYAHIYNPNSERIVNFLNNINEKIEK